MVETLHYFTTRGWNFETNGLLEIWNSISDDDKQVYIYILYIFLYISYIFLSLVNFSKLMLINIY